MKIGITLFATSLLGMLTVSADLFKDNQDVMTLSPKKEISAEQISPRYKGVRIHNQWGQSVEVWRFDEMNEQHATAKFGNTVRICLPISFNQNHTGDIGVGDVVAIPLPDGNSYTVIVDYVNVTKSGETTWSGYLDGFTIGYPVIFTIGKTNSFGTIATPAGLYAMEAINESGWLYTTPEVTELAAKQQSEQLASE